MRLFIIGILFSLSIAGCGGNPQLAPSPSGVKEDDVTVQAVRNNTVNGRPYLLSAKPFSRVAVQQVIDPSLAQFGSTFDIKVINASSESVSFGPHNVSIRQDGATLKLTGFEEAKKQVEARNRTTQVLGGVVMVLGAANVGLATFKPTAMSQAVISQSRQSMAMAAGSMQSASADAQSFNQEASKTFMGPTSIPPNGGAAGLVAVPDLSGAKPIQILVRVGHDEHEITFVPAK